MPLVRPPCRGCSPAPPKFPSRRFGSCSLAGAPFTFFFTSFLGARVLVTGLLLGFAFLATTLPSVWNFEKDTNRVYGNYHATPAKIARPCRPGPPIQSVTFRVLFVARCRLLSR